MKRMLLLLSLIVMYQVSAAQTNASQNGGKRDSVKIVSTKGTVADTATNALNTKLIWRTPATQVGLNLYISLQFKEAYAKFQEAVTEGDNDAYYFMGRMHQYRQLKYDTVQIDTVKEIQNASKYFAANTDSARYYFQKAVDEGSLLGHLGLAELMVINSDDEMRRFTQHMRTAAIEIREKAVDGDAFCNRILGSMYYTGYGALQDMGLAMNYLNRAAEKGDIVTYCYMANMYIEGKGVAKDYKKAEALLKKGVEAGDREALYTLGLLYEEGTLGEVKIEEARKLYRKAVSKGSPLAYEQLTYINQTTDQKLAAASIHRNPDMMKRALAAGADVNTVAVPDDYQADLKGRTPLMHTIYVPMLLEDYGEPYKPLVRLQTASLLLREGADVNAQDNDGKSALHYIVSSTRIKTEFFEQEQIQLIDTLLHYGANPNIQDKNGNTVLAQALQATIGQHIGILDLEKLLAAGADPNVQNNDGKTPLMLACEINANFEIILALLQGGADATVKDNTGKAAIDFTNHENVENILMAAGSPKRQ
ncbi:ankyrin repeat domain-containing protein [Pontibacter silvestris]|uniref:Ankyrin repeat domain-containing protein n=1 Tax=Pontibacter silvestris TaxID=2305183 RepID=A0ABW4WVH5_9BACT|nr:ankyrin repeat domain-containing protein [Pontibacter silvestris]MCC9137697.1 ankyrin repeat domain-containing protein [Pontibacter silvestris]